MRRSNLLFLLAVSAPYFAIILIIRSFLPPSFRIPLYFLAAPLLIVVISLLADLTGRVTIPTRPKTRYLPRRKLGRGIEQLTKQLEVAKAASPGYYDTVLLARLRNILVEKVSLETGMEKEQTRETLKNKLLGPALLHDKELYVLLYSGDSASSPKRLRDLDKTIMLIETWKP